MRTRVFRSGNSLAVRLPKGIALAVGDAEIEQRGDEIVLRQRPATLEAAFDALASMPADGFAEARRDEPPQRRIWDKTPRGRAARSGRR